METWLAHRSLATLDVRLRRQCGTALRVAEAVQRNFDEVSEVHVGIGTRLGLSRLRQQIDEPAATTPKRRRRASKRWCAPRKRWA